MQYGHSQRQQGCATETKYCEQHDPHNSCLTYCQYQQHTWTKNSWLDITTNVNVPKITTQMWQLNTDTSLIKWREMPQVLYQSGTNELRRLELGKSLWSMTDEVAKQHATMYTADELHAQPACSAEYWDHPVDRSLAGNCNHDF